MSRAMSTTETTALPILYDTPEPKHTASESPASLLERYLIEQQDLTAVERFSQLHDRDVLPLQEQYYRSLIPLSQPGPGQQYGFEVE